MSSILPWRLAFEAVAEGTPSLSPADIHCMLLQSPHAHSHFVFNCMESMADGSLRNDGDTKGVCMKSHQRISYHGGQARRSFLCHQKSSAHAFCITDISCEVARRGRTSPRDMHESILLLVEAWRSWRWYGVGGREWHGAEVLCCKPG